MPQGVVARERAGRTFAIDGAHRWRGTKPSGCTPCTPNPANGRAQEAEKRAASGSMMYRLVTRAQSRVSRAQSVLNFYNPARASALRRGLGGFLKGKPLVCSRCPPAGQRVGSPLSGPGRRPAGSAARPRWQPQWPGAAPSGKGGCRPASWCGPGSRAVSWPCPPGAFRQNRARR